MKRLLLCLMASMCLLWSGCGKDNPVQPESQDHDHAEAYGVAVRDSAGGEICRYERGTVTGGIALGAGSTRHDLSVIFIDKDGELFMPEAGKHPLRFAIADGTVATAEPSAVYARFSIRGLKAGLTGLTVKLMHGDHEDFVSAPLPVEVLN